MMTIGIDQGTDATGASNIDSGRNEEDAERRLALVEDARKPTLGQLSDLADYYRSGDPDPDAETREHREARAAWLESLGDELIGQDRRLFEANEAVAFLERDRMAISAERNEAQETIRTLRAQLAAAQSGSAADAAFDATCAQVKALLRPSNVEALLQRVPESLTPAEAAEVALWGHAIQGRAIRFVAELATMTDTECDFLDGFEVKTIASLLQVPDDDGNVAPTVPRLYSENDRDRAASALRRRASAGRVASEAPSGTSTDGERYGDTVDVVAEALGMRRAGA